MNCVFVMGDRAWSGLLHFVLSSYDIYRAV